MRLVANSDTDGGVAAQMSSVNDPAPSSDVPVYRLDAVGYSARSATGTLEILRDVTLELRPGEIVGVVGRSGVGKTTLLRLMGGLLQPTSGSIQLYGKRLTGPPATAATVFQDYVNALLPWRTVERNVALPLEGRVPRAELKHRVAEALKLVGLQDRGKDYPWRLSGGMQQRVQIARALVLRPSVLLMDEPFGALDAMTKANQQDELLRLHQETNATILFITHDVEEAIYLGDRVFVLAGRPGRLAVEVASRLPRPRDQITTREHPAYLEARHSVYRALREGQQ